MATTVAAQLKDLRESTRPLSRLVRFFTRYPPAQYSALATGQVLPTFRQRKSTDSKPLSATNLPQADLLSGAPTLAQPAPELDNTIVTTDSQFQSMITEIDEADHQSKSASSETMSPKQFPPNPFLPYKNPATGRWRGARVGLRQQADLYRYARDHGIEVLLPPSIKSSTYKQQRALERGLAVKGTGEGQQVKGHKWERQKASTLEKRRKAMEGMPELIREWEQRGHGRGWKKYPR